ncbi:hypothetical protein CRG98_040618 [Punica granatum]|uniref:Uncharacterized protein n=1 Tax=Punica granatum TaxID=22663 RepID=A0A2I0I598_PUNGR|nr:hypothetical protein CRG98_040618 [Punica granatum]
MNSAPNFGRESSCGKPVGQNGVLTIVDVPAREPYSDSKVPWTYEGGIGSVEQQFSVMGVTHSGVTEEEAEAFMKIIKASEYKVVEQMAKSLAHISLFALLLNSEPHREALLRVLTAAKVPKETPPDRIEETVSSIFSNTICAHPNLISSGHACAKSKRRGLEVSTFPGTRDRLT